MRRKILWLAAALLFFTACGGPAPVTETSTATAPTTTIPIAATENTAATPFSCEDINLLIAGHKTVGDYAKKISAKRYHIRYESPYDRTCIAFCSDNPEEAAHLVLELVNFHGEDWPEEWTMYKGVYAVEALPEAVLDLEVNLDWLDFERQDAFTYPHGLQSGMSTEDVLSAMSGGEQLVDFWGNHVIRYVCSQEADWIPIGPCWQLDFILDDMGEVVETAQLSQTYIATCKH